jgi:hypothetical protein
MNDLNHKPLASLSLDLDNQWSYMKTHGDPGWEKYPSYMDTFIPHVLGLLTDLNLTITFFIVGHDAVLEKNKTSLRELTRKGHEIGNHSFNHEVWLHQYSKERIYRELAKTEEAIFEATQTKPVGYRGPGFTWSANLFEVLHDLNYTYDASTLPTLIGPLARMYFFRSAHLDKKERKNRANIYGKLSDGFKPQKPYFWGLDQGKRLLEIPVTTIPFFKFPFHLSYLIYLSRISDKLMTIYLQLALALCRLTATQPSFLLHPLDLIGGDQLNELAFFPGMDLSTETKVGLFKKVIHILSRHFQLVAMGTFASKVLEKSELPVKICTTG